MENHYFIEQALRSLSKQEHRRFEKFLLSPYFHNVHSDCHTAERFYRYLIKYLPKLQLTDDDYKTIVLSIYPPKAKEWKKILARLKHDLLLVYYRFIAQEHFANDSFQYFFTLSAELQRRKLEDIYVHYFKPGLDKILAKGLCEPEQSYYNWRICRTVNKHKENSPSKDRQPRYKIQETGNGIMATRIKTGAEDIWLERPDYVLEKMLLKECFKNHLKDLEMREQHYTRKREGGGGKIKYQLTSVKSYA